MEALDIEWVTLLTQLGVATIPAILAYFGVRATNRSKVRASQGPEWSEYAKELRANMNDYREQVASLSLRVGQVEGELHTLRDKYRGALNHITVLRDAWPRKTVMVPALPSYIEEDM